uniref:TCP-1/cpn60 chaperonin family protein n=1 Tax=Tanacetum cinerariifolium TaxID=118510 RepID=A0A6L2MMI6_TANCI|nr:TCP-1/cpn60 chaperonin family protein [Tanacetum cinerariifolium]
MVAEVIGVTLGPKGRNVVLQNKYGPPKIVNDGETVLKEIQLEDPLENVGVKLVRQAGAKTNDLAGDGSTTSIMLAHGLIAEGVKVIATGMNPIQISRGIQKTADALVLELKLMSREVEDHELSDVAAISAGNDVGVGNMIAKAMQRVGRNGFISIEKGNSAETNLEIVEGMRFDRGYLSKYFTDRKTMKAEFQDCKLLLVDKIITNPKDMYKVLDFAVKGNYPVVIIAENVEKEALAPVIRNKLKGILKAAAVKAPAFGERKSHYLDDIAILTGGTVIREDAGLTLERVREDMLGSASKVVIDKDSTLIVTDGRTQAAVKKRVAQIQKLVENTEENFQKRILNERVARLSGGIAIIKVGAQTQVVLKDKQLRMEDAVNATKAAIEEGVVVGGGCCLLRLSLKVNEIKKLMDNEEQKIGAEIFKRALEYPARQIAKNAGVNGSVVIEKVLSNDDVRYGYNAASNEYEDLMAAGIIDPTKVVRCCIEHAASVAKTFLTSDAVVIDIDGPVVKGMRPPKQTPSPTPTPTPTQMQTPMPSPMQRPMPMRRRMPNSGIPPMGFKKKGPICMKITRHDVFHSQK